MNNYSRQKLQFLCEIFYDRFTNRKKDCIQLLKDVINLGNKRRMLYFSATDNCCFLPRESYDFK